MFNVAEINVTLSEECSTQVFSKYQTISHRWTWKGSLTNYAPLCDVLEAAVQILWAAKAQNA